ncbi:MAG TPA: nucleotide exchange factor GrpE [Acidimicrobiales bacterium]|nr:nucleotide exchange factor GrpE [Acidimicrobiales bacterium]
MTALLMDELRDAREELHRSWDRGPRSAEHLVRHVVIPTLDVLEDAAKEDPDNLEEVVRICAGLAQSTGVERIYPLGELVDPREHQVVGPPAGAGSRAVAVLRPGYRYDGRLLRLATVRAEGAGDEGQVG